MADELILNATAKAMANMANVLVKAAQNNLQASGHITTGALAQSIQALPPQFNGGTISINIQALPYLVYINKGVRGTQSGSGMYAFTKDFPGTEMITALQAWVERRGINAPVKLTIRKMANNN